jgi:hypothetical protein
MKCNIAGPSRFEFIPDKKQEDIALARGDLLLLGGLYLDNLMVWWTYQSIFGDYDQIAIHWFGSDVAKCSKLYMDGERRIFDILRGDRFLHIPCAPHIKEELEDKLGLEPCEPLIVPAEKTLDRMPPANRFQVAVYLPSLAIDFYNSGTMVDALEAAKVKTIFYHFMFKSYKLEFIGPHEYRYGINREEYEQVIADSAVLLRCPNHDGMSVGAAEFLMAGRPVLSTHDLPMCPKSIDLPVDKGQIKKELERVRDNGSLIPEDISDEARMMFDPKHYRGGLAERVKTKWGLEI